MRSTKDWTDEALPIHGYRISDEDGREIVRDMYMRELAEQIVDEHNAVMFAIRSGANWTLEDWQNWLRHHAQKES